LGLEDLFSSRWQPARCMRVGWPPAARSTAGERTSTANWAMDRRMTAQDRSPSQRSP